ncbi:hypothetical protein [Clostridium sp. JNZ J1-5]
MDYKYYRLKNNDDLVNDLSLLSLSLQKVTGYYANDYINPVKKSGGNLITIISDESEFKNHFCVSLILFPFLEEDFLNLLEKELGNLIYEYNIINIHFTDIFGKNNVLGSRRNEFIEKYIEIVSKVPLTCLSISKDKDGILCDLEQEDITNDELYFALFWNNFERIIPAFKDEDLFHICVEQEYDINNPSKYKDIAEKLFLKLYSGINQMSRRFPNRYISICKHPNFFSKKALLYSSLADLVAYSSNKIQHKIDIGVPKKKIQKEYSTLLKTIQKIFVNYSGLSSKQLVEMVNEAT